MVNLIQLILQPEKRDISANLEQMGWFPLVVANGNQLGVRINYKNFHFFLVWFTAYEKAHLFIEVSGRYGPQKLSVQCGPHKKIMYIKFSDCIIRNIHHPRKCEVSPIIEAFQII